MGRSVDAEVVPPVFEFVPGDGEDDSTVGVGVPGDGEDELTAGVGVFGEGEDMGVGVDVKGVAVGVAVASSFPNRRPTVTGVLLEAIGRTARVLGWPISTNGL